MSSTLWKRADLLCNTIMVYQGIEPDIAPIITAAHGSTIPAQVDIIMWDAAKLLLLTFLNQNSVHKHS